MGDAAAGLEELRAGKRDGYLVSRQLDPTPRAAAGVALAEAGLASAMIDVSDGVLADLGHICELSAVGASIELARIPLSKPYRALALPDPFALALSGGEDYELLFCVRAERAGEVESVLEGKGVGATLIGAIRQGSGIAVLGADGAPYTPGGRGFDHFG